MRANRSGKSPRAAACFLLAVLLAAGVASASAVDERIEDLAREATERIDSERWDDALAAIRRMTLVDADHPRAYALAMNLELRRGRLGEAETLLDTLGSVGSPGAAYGRGFLLLLRGKTEEGRSLYDRALAAYTARGHAPGEAACHLGIAGVDLNRGKLADADTHYRIALRAYEQIGDRSGVASAMSGLARLELKHRRPDAALDLELRALAIRRTLHERTAQARSWRNIAEIRTEKGEQTLAVEAARKSVELARSARNRSELISALGSLSRCERARGRFKDAVAAQSEARRIAIAMNDPAVLADETFELGMVLMAAGEYEQAARTYEEAALLAQRAARPEQQVLCLNSLGACLNRLGEYPRSRVVLTKALELALTLGDRSVEAKIRNGLGNTRLAAGETSEALLDYERALELHRKSADARGEIGALNNIGAVYYELRDFERARGYFEEALERAEAAKDPRAVARGRRNLGTVLLDQGEAEKALEQILASLSIWREREDRRNSASAGLAAAEVLLQLGRVEEALRLAEEALDGAREAGNRAGEANAWNLLGEIRIALGKPGEAVEAYGHALAIAKEFRLQSQSWLARAGASRALEASDRHPEALAEALRGLDELERVRANLDIDDFRTRYLAGRRALYEQALDLLLPAKVSPKPTVVARSFEVSERAHARGLLDALAESRTRPRLELDPDLKRREDLALAQLAEATARSSEARAGAEQRSARRQVATAERELESVQIEFRRRDPIRASWIEPRVASLDEVRSALDADTVLLSFFIGAERAWLWIVSRGEARLEELASPREIRERVEALRLRVEPAVAELEGNDPVREAAARLAQIVLPKTLPPAKRILIAPDGPLHHVPFDALVLGDRFLLESYEVAVVPSASALRLLGGAAPGATDGRFLGVGAPLLAPGEDALPPLPHAKAELEAIAGLFPADRTALLVGARATKEALRSVDPAGFRYVHFATHGWLDPESPRHSGLVMTSGSEGARVMLTQSEIMASRLAAELVVLSSCRSGTGELLEGEGLVGLTRAFLYAGARSVIATLWDVEDRASMEIMRPFYRGVQDGKTVSQSLREAKLRFLTSDRPDHRRPRLWAPFVFVGDPSPRPGRDRTAVKASP